jgi:pimeloyl-ACP methyl ester carboxylesterase
MAGSAGMTRSGDGTTIAFERSGQGPPVVLVGGAFQHRSNDPQGPRLAALLAPRFTVFRYDRRGRGGSGDTPPYAVEREVEDLDALLTEAGGAASVYGMSSGAVLALRAAASGLAIQRLALYEPPFVVDGSRPPLPAGYVARLTELASSGRRADAVEFFLTTAVHAPPEFVARLRAGPGWPALEAVAHTLAYDGAVMGDTMAGQPLPAGPWASVTAPTLVMAGGESPDWLRHAAKAASEALPHARHRTLAGQDHAVAGDVLAPVLAEFFSG